MKSNSKFGVLLILDGFGIRKERDYNCIALARTPVYDYLVDNNNGLNIIKNNGSLRDVAPTILHLLRPEEKEFLKNSFKGTSLVEYL